MECVLRAISENGNWILKVVHNPGKFRAPKLIVKESTFYICFEDETIIAAFTQAEGFDQIVNSQLEYQDGGITFRFVTNNNEAITVQSTIRVFLAKEEKILAKPEHLGSVMKLNITKPRPQ